MYLDEYVGCGSERYEGLVGLGLGDILIPLVGPGVVLLLLGLWNEVHSDCASWDRGLSSLPEQHLDVASRIRWELFVQ